MQLKYEMCTIKQAVAEGFFLVGGAEAAAEVKDGVVIVQRQEFPKSLCDVSLEVGKKQVISFGKRTGMQVSWHNSLLRTIIRCGIVKERLRGTILKQPTLETSIYPFRALA